jgi:formate C-acetyltransferase
VSVNLAPPRVDISDPWRGFCGTNWREHVDVAGFIRANVRPYPGDDAFLSVPTARTT